MESDTDRPRTNCSEPDSFLFCPLAIGFMLGSNVRSKPRDIILVPGFCLWGKVIAHCYEIDGYYERTSQLIADRWFLIALSVPRLFLVRISVARPVLQVIETFLQIGGRIGHVFYFGFGIIQGLAGLVDGIADGFLNAAGLFLGLF